MDVSNLPRVKPEDLEAQVKDVSYFRDGTLTVCVVTTQNGFKLVGESACAHPDLYNEELGQKLARENAMRKLWPLMGYELRSKLHSIESTTFVDRLRAEYAFVSNNVEKLRGFMLTPEYLGLEEDARNDLKTQYDAMIPYMEILNTRLSKLGV